MALRVDDELGCVSASTPPEVIGCKDESVTAQITLCADRTSDGARFYLLDLPPTGSQQWEICEDEDDRAGVEFCEEEQR
jgi:hypothetical protein